MSSEFWFMRAKSATRDTWVSLRDQPDLGETVTSAVARGETAGPVQFEIEERGRYVGDLLWASGAFVMVASTRFCDTLTELGATGWTSHPARIHYKNGEELPGYHLFVPTGHCDDFRHPGNAWDWDDFAEAYVDVSPGWDGSDVFYYRRYTSVVCITNALKDQLTAARLERLDFERPQIMVPADHPDALPEAL